ncbi:MAG: molybdopterin-guanine dinucleotide biosynthesis protein B [Candidatus Thermoplasmatota archaeon]|nr:molybdopterin-guanine dinucleotide biosynthesis protein B [Candidatus Thermoplasmatota archaeon]MBU1940651.1 molybdopterin-guanine dinucleotide biosynthesis protein B [Candidatus Thermoplasmatota archaeon]
MSTPKVLGIYGFSNTGKTTIILDVIKRLQTNALKVAVIKCSSQSFDIDTPKKDTWQHQKVGADPVLFCSPHQTLLQTTTSLPEDQAVAILSQITPLDIIIIEGSIHPAVPKIRIGSIPKRKNTLATIEHNDINTILQIINKEKLIINTNNMILIVNGLPISLSEFPSQIIEKTVLGMLSSLHGVTDIESFHFSYQKPQ